LPIFGEKIGVFLKNHRYDHIFAKPSCSLSKKHQFFHEIFRRKFYLIITSVPGTDVMIIKMFSPKKWQKRRFWSNYCCPGLHYSTLPSSELITNKYMANSPTAIVCPWLWKAAYPNAVHSRIYRSMASH
jgi:hypothetical protein